MLLRVVTSLVHLVVSLDVQNHGGSHEVILRRLFKRYVLDTILSRNLLIVLLVALNACR